MSYSLSTIFLSDVKEFIQDLPKEDRKKFKIAETLMAEGDFVSVYIKQIRGDIKELRIKKYRLLFFIHKNTIYFVRLFIKKSNKTPLQEINFAEKCYKLIINN